MHTAQSFARDYTRMLIVLALPLIVLILAKVLFGVLPTHHYHPNRVAYNGEQVLLWLHVATDLATGLSYVWISAVMAWLLYCVRDALPFHTVGIAFTAFIVSCGASHLAHVWTMFLPNHWAEATIKGVMAVASVATAFALPPVVPVVVGLVRSAQLSEQRAAEIRSRDEFLSVAAHEFKTPITTITAYTQMLRRRLADTLAPRDQRALTVVGEQTERLTGLVETLLDLSRIETGRLVVERATLSLTALIVRLVDELAPISEQHPLTLAGDAHEVTVTGDAQRLRQVFQNLLSNAIKYSPQGGPIAVALEMVDGRARVSVTDHGIGIPPEALPYLFDRFYRAGNVDQHGVLPGFGIGLYVVKEIVEQHGGTISVESAEGRGSTFTVALPLQGGV